MERYVIDFKDKNVKRAIKGAYAAQIRTGIPTHYRPAVKTKHWKFTES